MPAHARFIARICNTADRRVIQWWECELVDDAGDIVRLNDRAFFSVAQARSWATTAGYPIIDLQPLGSG